MSGPQAQESRRPLVRVPVPPGTAGPLALLPHLAAALDGSGPAIAPIPTVTSAVSNDYVMSLLSAVRAAPTDPPLESDDVAVVLATSGSTGSPRGVLLTAGQLTSLTSVVNGPDRRPQWVLALPVTSMGGLNVLIRALAVDRSPVCLPSLGGAEPFTPTAFHHAVEEAWDHTDDVRVSLVPPQLARLISDDAGIEALRACTQVLVGGASTRDSLLDTCRELGVGVTTTYGATETAGGCVFDGVPLPGVTVTTSTPLHSGPGLITIHGPCVALGYRGEPDLSRERFSPGAFVTTDVGFVSPSGSVQVVGRADDVVIINGINVSPGAVERVIGDLPDIVSAAVVAVLDANGDPSLVAFIEVRDEAGAAAATATAAVAETLGRAARPSTIRQVARLPHLPNGKVDSLLLQEWARTDEGM